MIVSKCPNIRDFSAKQVVIVATSVPSPMWIHQLIEIRRVFHFDDHVVIRWRFPLFFFDIWKLVSFCRHDSKYWLVHIDASCWSLLHHFYNGNGLLGFGLRLRSFLNSHCLWRLSGCKAVPFICWLRLRLFSLFFLLALLTFDEVLLWIRYASAHFLVSFFILLGVIFLVGKRINFL